MESQITHHERMRTNLMNSKVIFVGGPGVGTTSIVRRIAGEPFVQVCLCRNQAEDTCGECFFSQEHKPTIGFEMFLKKGVRCRNVVLWDVGSEMINAPPSHIALIAKGVPKVADSEHG